MKTCELRVFMVSFVMVVERCLPGQGCFMKFYKKYVNNYE